MEILHAAEFLEEYLCHNSHAQSFGQGVRVNTLFETENEWLKNKPVPISLPRSSRNFPNDKTRKEKKSIIGPQR